MEGSAEGCVAVQGAEGRGLEQEHEGQVVTGWKEGRSTVICNLILRT